MLIMLSCVFLYNSNINCCIFSIRTNIACRKLEAIFSRLDINRLSISMANRVS